MHRPRKRFGQHFLTDKTYLSRMILDIAPNPDDAMVEIGPGLGALTVPLLTHLKKLHVIELDKEVIPHLEKKCQAPDTLVIHQADVLSVDFSSLPLPPPIRVVGNLPYNISTPLFFHLLTYADCIQDMHFMVQQEVAERVAALPGEKAYGRLSIMMQYHADMTYLFFVPPEAFSPPPKVDSAVIRIIPHKTKPAIAKDEKRLADIVRTAFNQRRKTLRNSLKEWFSVEDFEACGINPTARPETLGVSEFVRLSNLL